MGTHSGNWYPVGPILWDASGAPYQNTSDGQKSYIPPIAAAQYQNDPKMLAWAKSQGANVTYGPKDANGNPTTSDVRTGAPAGGFSGNSHWNGETGQWEKDNFFDSSLGGLVLGGSAVAAPFAVSALAGAPAATPAEFAVTSTPGLGGATVPTVTGAVNGAASAAGAGGSTSILGTIAKFAGFDPKNPMSYLDLAGKIGNPLGAAAKGAADARLTQAGVNQRQDQLEQQRYGNQITGAKFALTAPQQRASNSVKGDILANASDFAWGAPTMSGNIPIPSSTGGLRPSLFSGNTRALGQQMSSDALAGAKAGTDNLPVPGLTPLPEAGLGSDILTTAGAIGGLADAFNPALSKLQSQIPLRKKPVDPTMEMY